MKKKLLITMGCSFTEGVGCWDLDSLPENLTTSHPDYRKFWYENKPNFHKLGWPNRLGKKLGYDKVINLGLGGSSTSGQAKWVFNEYLNKDFSEWDVLVVWLLSDASRISFYKDGEIVNQMNNPDYPDNHAYNGYIKFLSDSKTFNEDLILEQLFYRNIIKTICELKSYNFLTFNLYSANNNHIFHKFNRNDKTYSPIFLDKGVPGEYFSKICSHWNELGYEYVATNMYNWIKCNFTNLVNDKINDEIEWEWNGRDENKNTKNL
jgi:hypothetical protein